MRLPAFGGVHIYKVIIAEARLRTGPQPLRQVTMRINEGEASLGLDVLPYERLKEARFAHARLADDIDVGEAVGLPDAERHPAAAEGRSGEV